MPRVCIQLHPPAVGPLCYVFMFGLSKGVSGSAGPSSTSLGLGEVDREWVHRDSSYMVGGVSEHTHRAAVAKGM